MDTALEILCDDASTAPLDRGALELARIEFPGLVIEPLLDILDSYASEVDSRLSMNYSPVEQLQVLHQFLFVEQGFQGNQGDYYNPKNSCLNEVIVSRQGIPISLSILYLSIADRLDLPVTGVSLPGHFVCRFDSDEFSTFIDVFHEGRLLEAGDCLTLAKSVTGTHYPADSPVLEPVSSRAILLRTLHNLRSIYLTGRQFPKAAEVLNLLVKATPDDPSSRVLRAAVNVELRNYKDAEVDFERYLELEPGAEDRQKVEQQLALLRRFLRQHK